MNAPDLVEMRIHLRATHSKLTVKMGMQSAFANNQSRGASD